MLLPTKESNESEHHNSGRRVGVFKETEGKAEKLKNKILLSTLCASTNTALNLRSIKSQSDLTPRPWKKKSDPRKINI